MNVSSAPIEKGDSSLSHTSADRTKRRAKRGAYKVKALSQNPNPRIYLQPEVVADLVAIGVPDNPTGIARAVGEITKYSIAQGKCWLPNLGEVGALEAILADRIATLNCINAKLLEQLGELAALRQCESENKVLKHLVEKVSL